VVTLSGLILASSSASVQQTTTTPDKTEDLLSLFQEAEVTVVEILRQFEVDDKTIPQASLNEYNQAIILAEESRSLLQAGSYSEADGKIVQAFQKLKEALRIVYTTFPDQPTETEIALEMTVQLQSSINRYYEQLQRIENLTRLAATVGFSNSTLEAKIQSIKALLERASSNVNQKGFEAASNNLAEAKTLIDQILGSLNNFAANLKIERIATYITQTEVRLDTIRETAESLSNAASLAALDNAETSLDNAKEYLESQRINDTLSELIDSKESEEEAAGYLKPTASSLDFTSSGTPNAVQSP
jgi:hypothetical protein